MTRFFVTFERKKAHENIVAFTQNMLHKVYLKGLSREIRGGPKWYYTISMALRIYPGNFLRLSSFYSYILNSAETYRKKGFLL
jgi:hypothetical protein